MTDERIITKIKALLALAGNNTNQHEAAAAAAKAQELMVAYNLSMGDTENKTGLGGERKNAFHNGGLYKWQRTLWNAIAQLHFCEYWYQTGNVRGQKYSHRLLGSEVNVVSAQILAEYLEDAIQRYARDKYGYGGPRLFFSREANQYRDGMATMLAERLNDKRREAKAEERRKAREREAQSQKDGTANALVITIEDIEQEERWANEDWKAGAEPGTHKAKALKAKADSAAWWAQYQKRREAEKEADDLLKANDPEKWARKEADYAARKAKEDAEWEKRQRRNEKRRKGTGAHREGKPRPAAFFQGMVDAKSISLNGQIDGQETKKLK